MGHASYKRLPGHARTFHTAIHTASLLNALLTSLWCKYGTCVRNVLLGCWVTFAAGLGRFAVIPSALPTFFRGFLLHLCFFSRLLLFFL